MENDSIIYLILGVLTFTGVGIYLWYFTRTKYDYNIFNIWNILRGIIAFTLLGCGYYLNNDIFLIVAGLLWFWTFIDTLVKTNIIIAILSLVFQIIAVIFVVKIISQLIKSFKN